MSYISVSLAMREGQEDSLSIDELIEMFAPREDVENFSIFTADLREDEWEEVFTTYVEDE